MDDIFQIHYKRKTKSKFQSWIVDAVKLYCNIHFYNLFFISQFKSQLLYGWIVDAVNGNS